MIKECKGDIGNFQYDSKFWEFYREYMPLDRNRTEEDLVWIKNYIGPVVNGMTVADIPEGLVDAEALFSERKDITKINKLPATLRKCCCMFQYSGIAEVPPLPDGIQDCSHMFQYTPNLKTVPLLPSTVTNCFEMFVGSAVPFSDSTKFFADDIERIIIYDDSQYEDGKSLNGGCYGFSTIYTREPDNRWRISYDTTADFEYCHSCGSFINGDHVCYDEYATDIDIFSILTKILPDSDYWFEFRKAKGKIRKLNYF